MRKFIRLSALLAMALGTTALTAQAQGAKQFGILAGVGFATMSDGDDFDGLALGTRTGFVGGLYFSLPVAPRMAIEPEVLYSMKGTKLEDFDPTIDVNNDYIEIPVLFKYNFNDTGGPYLLAGPAVGFSISCNLTDGTDEADCDELLSNTTTTFGGVLGLGFQKNRFGLEGRYDFEFGDAFEDIAAKNSQWVILARILIK